MPFAHSTLEAEETWEGTWTFNEFCTEWGICRHREEFHRFTQALEQISPMYYTDWEFLWRAFTAAQDAQDEADTLSDALAARHW